jgi:hypothetical protein
LHDDSIFLFVASIQRFGAWQPTPPPVELRPRRIKAHDLNVVAQRIDDEGGVVISDILGTISGFSVALPACLKARCVESMDGCVICDPMQSEWLVFIWSHAIGQ